MSRKPHQGTTKSLRDSRTFPVTFLLATTTEAQAGVEAGAEVEEVATAEEVTVEEDRWGDGAATVVDMAAVAQAMEQ